MKALSPVRGCYEAVCCLSERSLAIARGRGKSPAAEEPLSLLDDMNHCYSRLRELVPGVPRGTQLSQVEILQRVIDYILDLQVVLAEPAPGPPDGPHLPIQPSSLRNLSSPTTKGASATDLARPGASRTQVLAPVRDPGTLFGRKPEGMDGPQPCPAHLTSPNPCLEAGPAPRSEGL
ncbi:hypothetical protein R6Z07F_003491 [Ovis aries]|uniref:DNA-binding protein inhibitor ID-3 n=3 Tax=Ovis TaxID=9935 RepID=A0A836D9E8_SHEEP|nr:hypothetical protein JEQ12_010113 [Ovis aries]KAI4544714.1 hypothetical protein MG293_004980 [Ovis ammon polii]KAI4588010.1 hypothetical protein MJG53_002418 [Ovis ammon polii x Ovis aries]